MSDNDIIQDFLVESAENLDRLDRDLVGLEKNPQDKEALAGVFRTIHTIKGTCGFLGFSKLEKVAHVGENLLTRLRDGQLILNPEITTALLSMVDAVRQMLKEIQSTGQDGEADYPELRERLSQLLNPGMGAVASPAAIVAPSTSAMPIESKIEEKSATPPAPQKNEPAPVSAALPTPARGRKKGSDSSPRRPTHGKIGGMLVERGLVKEDDIARALEEQDQGDHRRLGEILVALGLARAEDVAAALQAIEAKPRDAVPETIRVAVNLLDKVMTLVGELVLARNQLLQFANTLENTGLHAVSQRMNLIATELQEEVMKTRMQPIGNIWAQFPRTVRDVALGCGKQVNIEMEGKETELDKTIIEAIKDPLTHLVRNSVDHGIELPEDRVKAGKDPTGRLILRAFHEGGQVNIEITDDGAGLNRERIRQKAVERGMVTPEQAARLSEREIFNLIFLPGFSTAQKVTNVSGRGVGMDVVKTNVEKIGGVVDVQSTPGQGTTVRVKIPLTLAIIPALVVTCGGDRYTFHALMLTELDRHGRTTPMLLENVNVRLAQSVTARNALGIIEKEGARELATMVYGEVRPGGHFRFANFGHPAPLVFSAEYRRFMSIDESRMVRFLALGLEIPANHPDRKKYYSLNFRQTEVESSDLGDITLMSPGDILVLYTDGVYDGSDIQAHEQLEAVLREHYRQSARDICNALLDYAVKQDETLRARGDAALIDDKTAFIVKRTS